MEKSGKAVLNIVIILLYSIYIIMNEIKTINMNLFPSPQLILPHAGFNDSAKFL